MQTELNSFLIEITALIFGKKDDKGGDGFLLDKVLDKTGMKGTGEVQCTHPIGSVWGSTNQCNSLGVSADRLQLEGLEMKTTATTRLFLAFFPVNVIFRFQIHIEVKIVP